MHILFFTFTLIKDIFKLRATLAILKLKLCLFANESFDGFQNISKFFDLVNFCPTGKL
jgi:hypothetical protein